jgi:integrase
MGDEKTKSTRQCLKKIATVNCLYRHEESDIYYAIKKKNNRIISASLQTTDRKLAERRLKEFVAKLDANIEGKCPTLAQGFENLKKAKAGNSDSTLKQYGWAYATVKAQAPGLLDIRIDQIKPSDLAGLFGSLKGWKATSYNSFTLIVKQVFDSALHDGMIPKNPYDLAAGRRRKVQRERDEVPTVEQCEQLVANIRDQPFALNPDASGDLCEFLHLAALGEAEANSLFWSDFEFSSEVIHITRKKTGVPFEVPFYPHLKPFIENLFNKSGRPGPGQKVFAVKSIKQSLYNACKRLGLPAYSPRDLRKARIVWMLRKGVAVENIAEWQGHSDNGILIRKTYAWVLDDEKAAFGRLQLEKMM